jgi:hypothetical protein
MQLGQLILSPVDFPNTLVVTEAPGGVWQYNFTLTGIPQAICKSCVILGDTRGYSSGVAGAHL